MSVEGLCSNDLRVSLTALRDVLVERLLGAEPRESAALARQLELVLVRLASLPAEEKSQVDDLTARRKERRAKVS